MEIKLANLSVSLSPDELIKLINEDKLNNFFTTLLSLENKAQKVMENNKSIDIEKVKSTINELYGTLFSTV